MQKLSYSLLFGLLLLVSSCGEDFLEIDPEQSVDIANAVIDLQSLNASTNGVYDRLQSPDAFGRTLVLVPDLMADNAFISLQNANRYQPQNEHIVLATDGFTAEAWERLYEVIVNANLIIAGFPNATFLDTELEEANNRLGEAHALRALAYWSLVRYYARPYTFTADASHEGVPVVNDAGQGSIIAPSRNTVAEVYAQIEADLNEARNLLTLNENGRANRDFATGLLAKVNLYKENWATAASFASEIIDSGNYTLYDSTNWVASWDQEFASESIFELINTNIDGAGINSIGFFYDQDGYGDAIANFELYNAFSDSDVRKQTLLDSARLDGENPAIIINKYPEGQPDFADNIKIMRLAELYLIRAEARAEQGDAAGAQADLNAIKLRVDPNATPSTATGAELISEIINERRLELAFEGDRLYDLVRRDISYTKFEKTEISFEVDPSQSDQVIAPIPQVERDANPNISQNPGYLGG